MATLGIRNNNPFNIRVGSSTWRGMENYSNNGFCVFKNLDYGLRAGICLLRTYIMRGFNTPEKIISRYAPSVENNVPMYIKYICQNDLQPDTEIKYKSENFYKLCNRILYYESKYTLTYDNFVRINKLFGL